jgi:hypothetical protein
MPNAHKINKSQDFNMLTNNTGNNFSKKNTLSEVAIDNALSSLKEVDLGSIVSSINFEETKKKSFDFNNNNYNSNQSNQFDFISKKTNDAFQVSKDNNNNLYPHSTNQSFNFIGNNMSIGNNSNENSFVFDNQNNTQKSIDFGGLGLFLNNPSQIMMEDRFDPVMIKKQLRGAIIVKIE